MRMRFLRRRTLHIWKIPVAFFISYCYNIQELNTQMVGAAALRICSAGGKRETGEKPVRSRHCEPESNAARCHCESEKARRCDDPKVRKPASHWYRVEKHPGHEELAVPNTTALCSKLGLLYETFLRERSLFSWTCRIFALNGVLFKEFLCEGHKEEELCTGKRQVP